MIDEKQKLDDEILSAYLDGELPPAQADQVTSRLAREPALARRLEAMRSVDEAAVAEFRSVDEQPIPQRVLDLIHADADEDRNPAAATNVVHLKKPALDRFAQWPVAIAASVALAFGFYLSTVLQDSGAPAAEFARLYASPIPPGSNLHRAFDQGLSTASVRLGDGRIAEPVLTFRSSDGPWCRQVRIAGTGRAADALACRREGSWEVELVSFDGPSSRTPDGPYGQASAGGSAAMDAAVERLMGRQPPLGPEEEAEIVENGWAGGGVDSDEME